MQSHFMGRRSNRCLTVGFVLLLVGSFGAMAASQPVVSVTGLQDTVRFRIEKASIEAVQVQIFDLTGRSLYQSAWSSGSTLYWRLVTRQGDSVAQGVYVYTLTAKDATGKQTRKAGKLVVMRNGLREIQDSEWISGLPTLGDLDTVESQHIGSYDVDHGDTVAYNIKAKYVGIGLTSPANKLDVMAASGVNPLRVRVGAASYLQILASGNVGIGTASPAARLVVRATTGTNAFEIYNDGIGSTGMGLIFRVQRDTGDVYADGSFNGGGGDVAERIDAIEPLEPGDVVEIDPSQPGKFRKAQAANSRLVAGIVSTQPGVVLGNDGSIDLGADDRPILALAGRVPVKAIAKFGAIEVGDLLVSSPIPGYAMKCAAASECVGAIIGKAMEPLSEGVGMIQVQVMLR